MFLKNFQSFETENLKPQKKPKTDKFDYKVIVTVLELSQTEKKGEIFAKIFLNSPSKVSDIQKTKISKNNSFNEEFILNTNFLNSGLTVAIYHKNGKFLCYSTIDLIKHFQGIDPSNSPKLIDDWFLMKGKKGNLFQNSEFDQLSKTELKIHLKIKMEKYAGNKLLLYYKFENNFENDQIISDDSGNNSSGILENISSANAIRKIYPKNKIFSAIFNGFNYVRVVDSKFLMKLNEFTISFLFKTKESQKEMIFISSLTSLESDEDILKAEEIVEKKSPREKKDKEEEKILEASKKKIEKQTVQLKKIGFYVGTRENRFFDIEGEKFCFSLKIKDSNFDNEEQLLYWKYIKEDDSISNFEEDEDKNDVTLADVMKKDKWNHLAVVYDGYSITTILNGDIFGSQKANYERIGANKKSFLSVGSACQGFNFTGFTGEMSEVMFYDFALSVEKVKELFSCYDLS